MTVELQGRTINRVAIIDDQPEVRSGYGYTVQDAELTPVSQDGPLGNSVSEYLRVSQLTSVADAGICDFQLNAKAYARFSGAELVAAMYRTNFPALLCTRYEKISIADIMPHRRWIPSLLNPNDLTDESLVRGLDECLNDMAGNFRANRRPWRTQIHFLTAENDYGDTFFAEIPGWELNEVIKIRLSDLPESIKGLAKPDFRCYAQVNLGAEMLEDLYWSDWELP